MRSRVEKIWKDPVWSKVISAFLIAVITLLYNFIVSYYNNSDFISEFLRLWQTKFSLWVLAITGLLFYILSYYLHRPTSKNKFVYDEETIALDRKLFNYIRNEIITNETLEDLNSHTFSNHSFEREKFNFIHNILAVSKQPDFEFLNPELEKAKIELVNAIKMFQSSTLGTIFSTPSHNDIGFLGIPREWDEKKFYAAMDKIEPEETNVFRKAESLIKLGRRTLKI